MVPPLLLDSPTLQNIMNLLKNALKTMTSIFKRLVVWKMDVKKYQADTLDIAQENREFMRNVLINHSTGKAARQKETNPVCRSRLNQDMLVTNFEIIPNFA